MSITSVARGRFERVALLVAALSLGSAWSCHGEPPAGRYRCDPDVPGNCPDGWYCRMTSSEDMTYRCFPDEAPPICGNGVMEEGEACDALDFGGGSCVGEGLAGGPLRCSASCETNLDSCLTQSHSHSRPGSAVSPSMLDKDPAQSSCSDRHKMGPALPVQALLSRETEIHLIHEGGRLERVIEPLPAKQLRSSLAELVIYERHQVIDVRLGSARFAVLLIFGRVHSPVLPDRFQGRYSHGG